MRKFVLDLASWTIDVDVQRTKDDGTPYIVKETIEYPIKENLGMMLRSRGLFDTIEDTVEAVVIGKQIQDSSADSIEIDQQELLLLKKCLDRHLEAAMQGKGTFGGPQHEELILRVHKLWRDKDKPQEEK